MHYPVLFTIIFSFEEKKVDHFIIHRHTHSASLLSTHLRILLSDLAHESASAACCSAIEAKPCGAAATWSGCISSSAQPPTSPASNLYDDADRLGAARERNRWCEMQAQQRNE